MKIAKRVQSGWTDYQPNKSKEVCDDCQAPLHVAPDGKSLFCDNLSDKHTQTITTWHVFGDEWDDWFDTLEEATKAFKEACKDKLANVRLYEDISEIDGDTVEENYLDGQGNFPY